MTGAQMSYLKTLSDEVGEEFDEKLNKAEASRVLKSYNKRLDAAPTVNNLPAN
jgi:hypothetical protein